MPTLLSPLQAATNATQITRPSLSVVVPVFNEVHTIAKTIARVQAIPCVREIILVDDGSTDGTPAALDHLARDTDVYLIRHEYNRGKGAALKTGFACATGEIVIVQDADLEYDPTDYPSLIEPILNGEADVVYGSRFLADCPARMSKLTRFANRLITWCFNRVFGLALTDVETCYKAISCDKMQQVLAELEEDRFGIEIELTARLAKLPDIRIVERPISYAARGYSDGKKIGWRDGLRALWCILKFRWNR